MCTRAVIEQYFFPHYSISQRHTMLTAIALGARELAGFPAPPPPPPSTQDHSTPSLPPPPPDLFPSKRLPPALHRRLLGPTSPAAVPKPLKPLPSNALDQIAAELTRSALSGAKSDAEVSIPLAAREKLLTVRRFASAPAPTTTTSGTGTTANYTTLAAEFFVLPLVNRFWVFLRETASSAAGRGPYVGGSDSASLLEPLILSRYLGTLAIVVHAARHSAHFLAVLGPETLELVLALRTAVGESDATVLASEMEVLLVVLDATVALDGGHALMRSVGGGANLVGDVKEWAEEVFESEERRGGEGRVGRTGRAAAGVLLRIDEVLQKWRGAVGW